MWQSTWTVLKSVRNEEDPLRQIMRIAQIEQRRYLASARELEEAQKGCHRLMPYYRKMLGQRRLIASSFTTSDWLDSTGMVCMVINPAKKRSRLRTRQLQHEPRHELT